MFNFVQFPIIFSKVMQSETILRNAQEEKKFQKFQTENFIMQKSYGRPIFLPQLQKGL